jgi:hypothetical protein
VAQNVGQISADGLWLWNGAEWVRNAPIAAPPSGVPWARPYESARSRATLITIFLLASIVTLVIGIAVDLLLIAFGVPSQTDAAGGGLSGTALIADLLLLAFLLAYVASYILAVVFFCRWVHRVVRNMPALGAWDPRWSPAGAVGRCFIPILNLVHPMSGTLEAWRGSDPGRRWINVTERKAMRVPGLIIGWWALWLIGSWVSSVGGRLSNNNDARTAASGDWISIAGSLLLVGAAILAIFVVREVTARQDHKNELIATGRLP